MRSPPSSSPFAIGFSSHHTFWYVLLFVFYMKRSKSANPGTICGIYTDEGPSARRAHRGAQSPGFADDASFSGYTIGSDRPKPQIGLMVVTKYIFWAFRLQDG
jgi:hypothetical protein